MNHPQSPDRHTRRFATAILIAFAVTVALIAAASLWPQSRLWGLGWYRFLPGYFGAIVLIGAVALVLGSWYRRGGSGPAARLGSPMNLAVLASLVLGALFILLRTSTHFLGDGYILLGRLESGAYTFQPWESVPFALERWAFEMLGRDAAPVAAFRVISWLSGAGFMVAAWWAAFRLFPDATRRRLFGLGLLSGGYMLLFFGYVEHYPLFVTVVAIFTLTGLFVAQDRCSRWWLLPSLVIGLMLHPFGVVLVVPSLYLLLRQTRLQHAYDRLSRPVRVVIPEVIVVLAATLFICFYATDLFFRLAFVPPVADRFTVEDYTLFSWHHLVDVFSLILQLVPGLLIFVVTLSVLPVRAMIRRPEYRFLALLSLLSLAIVFVFDPKIGLPRDWDLFAFAGVPLTVLAFVAVLDHDRPSPVSSFAAIAMLVLSVVLLAPRVATQASVDRSIETFEYLADLDPIRNKDGMVRLTQYYALEGQNDKAEALTRRIRAGRPELRLHERGMELTRAGQLDDAIAVYQRVLAIDPSMGTTWSNIGLCFLWQNRPDSALVYLEAADGVQPYNAITLHLLGEANMAVGRAERAERCWREVLRLTPDNIETYRELMSLYRDQRRSAEYRDMLHKAADRDGAPDDLRREARDSAAAARR